MNRWPSHLAHASFAWFCAELIVHTCSRRLWPALILVGLAIPATA